MYTEIYMILTAIFIIYFLNSCKKNSTTPDNGIKNSTPYLVDIGSAMEHVSSYNMSDLVERVEYIRLETSPDCLLKKVDKIMLSDSFMFISDFECIYKFDRKGKFISKIGRQGRGPGEYLNVLHFCIDDRQKLIYTLDLIDKFHVFSFNGNYVRSFRMKYPSFNFFTTDSAKLACNVPNTPKEPSSCDLSLYIMDKNGEIVKTFKNYHKRTNNFAIVKSPLYKFENTIRFKEHGVDTLYSLINNKLVPYAIFNIGNLAMEPDPVWNPQTDFGDANQKYRIKELGETKDLILIGLIQGMYSDSTINFVYDKKKGNTFKLDHGKFTNDLGGLPFWPKLGYYHDDRVLIDFTYAYDFKNQALAADHINNDQIKQIASIINENSNPIIIIGYLK
ncbi:MAG TPA: 6-bladed beta-propeller [Bacteroidales bacterium]|nr:6-bladed beta-propeller [Bacteroidales bacterium]